MGLISKLILFTSIVIVLSNQQLSAQDKDSFSSNESSKLQEKSKYVNHPIRQVNYSRIDESFTNYYSSRTTQLHSIGIGVGDKFNLWYYYLTPLLNLERMKYISFGVGFGGKGIGYVTYKLNGDLIDNNDNSYFFFLGGSIGFTFFITDRIFLHPTIGTEYWFGDTHSGSNYTYEYEDGFDEAGGFKTMYSIGLFSIIPTSRSSTTYLGFAINFNSYQYTSYNIVFTFY